MRLILLRHGETEHNRGQLTLGRADVPLNARGLLQARALADSFVAPPAALYASPLLRARQTADAIAVRTGLGVTIDDDLVEMDVGEMEHLTGQEMRERYPGFLQLWLSDPAEARMPGGETLAEVQARCWGAVQRILAEHGDTSVAVVAHNFVVLSLVCRALGVPLAGFRRIKHGVAARTVIDINGNGTARCCN